jgi:hypothetical protein
LAVDDDVDGIGSGPTNQGRDQKERKATQRHIGSIVPGREWPWLAII